MNNLVTMMTIGECAQATGTAKHFIRQLVLNGKICYVKTGSKYLINYEKLVDYLCTGDQPKQTDPPQNKIRRLY